MPSRSTPPVLRVGLLLACAALASCGTPPDYTPEELEAAKAELRDHVRLRTFEAGLMFGEEWVTRAPDDAELRALYAEQLAAWWLFKETREQADAILAGDPDNPWGHYAQALSYFAENEWDLAREPSLRAWETSPRPEFAAAHLQSLRLDGVEGARAFLAALDSATRATPELLIARAQLESQAQYELSDPAWADSSLATYAELREQFPDHVIGHLRAAENLFRANRPEEALPLIERAVALAPGSVDVRQWHWWILFESDVLPADERRPAVEASITEFTEAGPESIRGFSAVASMYRDMGDTDRAEELEALVVERAPLSRHASLIYAREYSAESSELNRLYQTKGRDSPEYRAQLEVVRDAVNRFLERPRYSDRQLAGAYLRLYFALSQMDPPPAEELAAAVRGLVRYDELNPHITYGDALVAMAESTPYAAEAAEFARDRGLEAAIDRVQNFGTVFRTEGEREQSLRYYLSIVYDAMGWGYFKAGRVEDGRHALERALALTEANREARYHLGQVYERFADEAEADGDEVRAVEWLDRAEDSYIAGLGSTQVGENPSQAAIEALYERRYGSRKGMGEYLDTLDERDQIRRRERILESRVEAAGTYEPFRLARIDGSLVDSADLDGKIAVVHFWGTWCGPCIVEMPEYQKFDLRYRDDPEVRVVSISNDNSRQIVDEYLARNDFDFEVLMDDGYVQRAGISGWPTTWFVDRDGYIQFVKRGNTSKLDEEFSWRVEALREETTNSP
ncbi:redoxin domain-containing protein [Candidatus Palauibacter sp.]|uniref:redoxin domain-containing protein n=1 Tax=Candidatus Palauibacter sp. TaxID=3101350 RepID=UPI003B5C6EE3